jgi:hypothetical protein
MLIVNENEGNFFTILVSRGKTCSTPSLCELLDASGISTLKGILNVK